MRMKNWKALLTALMLVLVLAFAVGGTIAWIIDKTDPVENRFDPSEVPPKVVEVIDGNTKKSVAITNDGNIPAFIRVAIVANWCDEYGNIVAPYTGSVEYNKDSWFKAGVYYYYNAAVEANESTGNLLEGFAEPTGKPEGTHLVMTIAAQSIQSVPKSTVGSVWTDVVVNDDGTLSAKQGGAEG